MPSNQVLSALQSASYINLVIDVPHVGPIGAILGKDDKTGNAIVLKLYNTKCPLQPGDVIESINGVALSSVALGAWAALFSSSTNATRRILIKRPVKIAAPTLSISKTPSLSPLTTDESVAKMGGSYHRAIEKVLATPDGSVCREREPTKDTEVLIEKPPDRDRLGMERDAVDGENMLHGSEVNVSERSAKALEAGKRILSSYASWDAVNCKWVPGSVRTDFKPAFSNVNKNHLLKLASINIPCSSKKPEKPRPVEPVSHHNPAFSDENMDHRLKPSSIKETSRNPDDQRPALLGKHLNPTFSDVNIDPELKLASINIEQETHKEAAKSRKPRPPPPLPVVLPTHTITIKKRPKPGKICSRQAYYVTRENDTYALIALMVGLESWKQLCYIKENFDNYGKLTSKDRFKRNTLLRIPTDKCVQWKLTQLDNRGCKSKENPVSEESNDYLDQIRLKRQRNEDKLKSLGLFTSPKKKGARKNAQTR